MKGFLDDAVMKQAVRLADGCARSDLESLGLEVGPCRYALTANAGQRARRLEDAHELLRDAASYLLLRQLALMCLDAEGLVLVLRLDRFD
jgi:hypothetical protein